MDANEDVDVMDWMGKPPRQPSQHSDDSESTDGHDQRRQHGSDSGGKPRAPTVKSTTAKPRQRQATSATSSSSRNAKTKSKSKSKISSKTSDDDDDDDIVEIAAQPHGQAQSVSSSSSSLDGGHAPGNESARDESDDPLTIFQHPPRKTRKVQSIHKTQDDSGATSLVDIEDEECDATTQPGLVITVPDLPDDAEDFECFPEYWKVERILHRLPDRKFIVQLASGEIDQLNASELTTEFQNGKTALQAFKTTETKSQSTNLQPPRLPSGHINWSRIVAPKSEHDRQRWNRRKIYTEIELSDSDAVASASSSSSSAGVEYESSDAAPIKAPQGRRSTRLGPKSKKTYNENKLFSDTFHDRDHLSQSSGSRNRPARRATRQASTLVPARSARRRIQPIYDSSSDSDTGPTRRSERARAHPRPSMRERQEDDLSSQSEKENAPRMVAAKEAFSSLPATDPFRKRHQQECASCYQQGDNEVKGPLVFCQGCSNSYHKQCLGPRSSRDHLVTKVNDNLFVLQCRRCLGVQHDKDPSAPHYGRCTGCDQLNPSSKPLRRRLNTKQEQIQREENGGVDPITINSPELINNPDNIMFRCATCNQAWHMHHLPNRKLASSGDSDEESLAEHQLAQRRFDMYHRSWICKDCVENQQQVDTLVAWRPVNQEIYVPGTTIDRLPESQKEYLVKWKNQSYLRCTWQSGTWIWGVCQANSRTKFSRKPENWLPRMTEKDAIPEEFHRIDIVFDVRYTSVVRNSSEQIDMARAKEVDVAFVKFKGLGYEDALWEKPPKYSDGERFQDFKDAYEDFIRKRYMNAPSASTVSRSLVKVRQQDFETKLIRKAQPAIMTGGQVMQYQLEGLNWLYYQWYRLHNAILADEMGLGKTIQLIALMATLTSEHRCWPFLVVVPNSTCPNWRREIKKWVPSLRAVCYYGSSHARKLTHDYELFPRDPDAEPDKKKERNVRDIKAHIVITSYESIIDKGVASALARVSWQGLIVDEGQRLKSDQNLIYEGLSKMRFPFKVLMTGTPLQNNARELFNLLQFLDRDKHNAAQLEVKYAELTQENVSELHLLLKPYFLRRTKVQVLTFLPPMSQIIIPVTMSALQKKVSKSIMSKNPALMKSIFNKDPSVVAKDRANLNNILMQLRKTLCHPFVYSREIEDRGLTSEASFRTLVEASAKLQLLSIMLPKLKERGHRVLLFSQFLDNIDITEDFLDGLGMLHHRLDGSISALEKQKRIDEFNAPNSPYFAFLLSTRAGGVGINLATADTVIIMDPDFNPHQDIQALSRAHRIGQQNKVLVFHLMTRNSAEEKIMQIGKKKMALDHVLIEAMDQDDDAGVDLETVFRHGAAALFDDESDDTIVYNDASLDKLLDRSQVESTKTSKDQSAESQFSFARIWANDRAELEEGIQETSGENVPNPDIWDKILKDREKAYKEEAARKAQELGRGKRKRGQVDYSSRPAHGVESGDDSNRKDASDGEQQNSDNYLSANGEPSDVEVTTGAEETEPEIMTTRARPFKRVKVPTGRAPHFNGDAIIPHEYTLLNVPAVHKCSACKEEHPMGWCRLKIAGVEHCGLCGLAHMGHGRTCPHLSDEKHVETLLLTLKESTESRELVDDAVKYLQGLRGHLVSQRRARERAAMNPITASTANLGAQP